jgi:hypothetical protein
VIQSGEHRVALGWELIEVLEAASMQRFRPTDLLKHLAECEAWGEALAGKKDDKVKAAAIGRFLSGFRLSSYNRSRTGSTYDRAEAIRVIRGHIPQAASDRSLTSATSATDPLEPLTSFVADQSLVLPPDLPRDDAAAPGWGMGRGGATSPAIDLRQPGADDAAGLPREILDKTTAAGNVAVVAVDQGCSDGSFDLSAGSFERPNEEMVEGEV